MEFLRRLTYLLRRDRFDNDLDAELQFHLETRADELVERGMTRSAALVQARREFGSTARTQEETRSAWQLRWLEDLASDLRYAARGFRRNPAFALTAIVCLALGIGANTTIFSVASEALFSHPTVRDPQSLRLVRVGGISHATMEDYRFLRDAHVFDGLTGEHEDQYANWRNGDSTVRLFAVRVTDTYFGVTGTPLAMGRGMQAGEQDAAVVSWRFWQERLGGDPDVLGRKLILDGRPHIVTGVLTRNHRTLFGAGISPDLYLLANDTIRVAMYARLAPGVGPGEARARLAAACQALDGIRPLDRKRADFIRITEVDGMGRLGGQSDFMPITMFFVMLMIVVSLVLLIACANVASLLLARASSRSREIAIRLSIGAGRGRLIRQLLAETLLLGFCGAAAGLAVNFVAFSWLREIQLPIPIPVRIDIHPDWRLLAYATAVAIGSSLVAGLAPALQGTRGGRAANNSKFRNGLVMAQIAASIVLLSAGFLFLRNLREATGLNPGFDVDRTIWASMRLVPESYTKADQTAGLIDRALDQLRATPGVETAAVVRVVPLNDEMDVDTSIRADGGNQIRVQWYHNEISPDYFRTIGIPLLAGRDFRRAERRVIIVNENFARRFFGAANPIGHILDSSAFGGKVEIVGIARNSSYFSLNDRDALAVYHPYLPESAGGQASVLHFLARFAGRPEPVVPAIRQTLDHLDPSSAIEVRPMSRALAIALIPSQAGALVLGSAGALGLTLAAVGLYGVLLYTVSRRVREIGVRVAIGATPGNILLLVLRHSMQLVAIGTAIGLAIAVFAVHPLALYLTPAVRPTDPLNFLAVAALLATVALIATAAPAIRALRIDPLKALRHE